MEVVTIKTTMSSREIAELTGKLHKDVMKAIRNMESAWEKVNGRKFALVEIPDAKGELRPCYELSKKECLYVATKFNDEARAKLIIRWEELEVEKQKGGFQIPQSFSQALALAAKQAEQIELQQSQIKEQAPKVLFAESVSASKQSILIGELAKILRQNGIQIGQNRLFTWMRTNNFLCKHGEKYNRPTQRAMEMGLFEVIERTISRPDKEPLVSITTKVTGKGQVYFIDKFLTKHSA